MLIPVWFCPSEPEMQDKIAELAAIKPELYLWRSYACGAWFVSASNSADLSQKLARSQALEYKETGKHNSLCCTVKHRSIKGEL